MSILFLLLTIVASLLLYLCQRHQGWLPTSLPAKPVLAITSLVTALALYCGWQAFSMATAIFAWLVITMLVLGLLPFFSLLKKKKTRGE